LALLCAWGDEGYQTSYLILQPVAFFLIVCGTFLDTMFNFCASLLAAKWANYQEDTDGKTI
jgi:Na+/H+-dicarboxylate symporter